MKKYLIILPILIALNCAGQVGTTQIYFNKNDVKVLVNGSPLPAAWCGGLNSPQFALADLNNDGKKDLVIYEKKVGVKTFVNTGVNGNPNYVYDGNYEVNFPGDKINYGYMKLIDYNRDNIPDLFYKGSSGINVNIGYYDNNNRLSFRHYKELYYYWANNWVNAYIAPDDLPAFVDIDKDGDLDFFSYNIWGSIIGYYRNCTIEDGLPKDSIKICYADECWGRVLQLYEREMVLGHSCLQSGTSCKGCPDEGSGGKGTHAGNTLCLLDIDNDGDFDALNGNISFSDIQLLRNGKRQTGSAVDSMVSQDTLWSSNGVQMKMSYFPAAYNLDIDQDGKEDLLFSPNAAFAENYKCVSFFRNTGTTTPNYVYQSDSYLVNTMIDLGSNSRPVLYDYNRDGKPDLFVGSMGYYKENAPYKVAISYYENISEKNYPTYKLVTKDFMGLSAKGLKGGSIAIGDANNDGLDDLIFGQTDGTVMWLKNVAADSAAQPDWSGTPSLIMATSNRPVDAGDHAAPLLYDVDKDGRNDLIIGNAFGSLYYYKNTGVAGNAAFDSVTNKLGNIKITSAIVSSTYSVPFIGAIDDSKKEYLLVGNLDGSIWAFDGFENGYTGAPYNLVDQKYQNITAGTYSAPTAGDVDGDGKYELIVGCETGGLLLYRQVYNVGVASYTAMQHDISIYPNPANDILTITWKGNFENKEVNITLVSATGQRMKNVSVPASQNRVDFQIGDLPTGIYYCVTECAGSREAKPVTIIR